MGNILYCEICPEKNQESVINLSDNCVGRITNDDTKKKNTEQEFVDVSPDQVTDIPEDNEWMKKLKLKDDVHSIENQLTVQAVEKLMNDVEGKVGYIRPQICSTEALIMCLQKQENCMIKCKRYIEEFIDCVDKSRIEIIKEKIKARDDDDIANTFIKVE